MHKKLMSLLIAVTLLATCLTALPVMAAGDALTDITSGGYYADATVMNNADILNCSMHDNLHYTYDKSSGVGTFYSTVWQTNSDFIKFQNLRFNDYDDATLEFNCTLEVKPGSGTTYPTYDSSASPTGLKWEKVSFNPVVNDEEKLTASARYACGIRFDNANYNQKSYPTIYARGMEDSTEYEAAGNKVQYRVSITKTAGVMTYTQSMKIGDTWYHDSAETPVHTLTGLTGSLDGIKLWHGNEAASETSYVKWEISEASLKDHIGSADLRDMSKEYYENYGDATVDFVLPKGYTTAAIEVEGTEVATLDSATYPAGAYSATLSLNAIGKKGHLDLTFGGTMGDGSNFTKTTTVHSGIDENWVAPTKIPAKVTFTTADGGELTALTAGTSVKATADASVTNPLVILGLYQDGILKAVKSGSGSATLTIPTGIDATKATLKAFMLNSYDDANTLVRAGQWNSSDATLADLLIAGKSLEGFSNTQDTYDVTLPASIVSWPTITPVANDSATSAAVSQTGAFPGTTTVDLTAEDGTSKTITLNWSQAAATVSNIKSTSGKTNFATVTLEKPIFKEDPGDLDMTATSDNANRNPLYTESNITNVIEVYPDRSGAYWIGYVPDAFVGATMLQMPYDSTQWDPSKNPTNVISNPKAITFDLDRSATVYVSGGRGFNVDGTATWMANGGWTKTTEDIPVVMNYDAKAGNYAYAYTARETYKKHYDVAEWGDKVQVDIGCIVWSANLIWVVFD